MTMEPMHTAFRRIDAGSSDMALSVTRESGGSEPDDPAPATAPINQARWRNRIRASGTVRAVRVHETETGSSLGCEIGDEAGSLLLVFPGRRRIPGIEVGARMLVEGMVGLWRRQLAIVNPYYELVSD
jgi:hypothetical protein